MYRQGDVLICEVDEIPKEAKPLKPKADRHILAEGESTGHSHSIMSVYGVLMATQSDLFLKALTGCVVEHQEHAPIAVGVGNYKVIIQREYTPEAVRRVAD